LSKQYDIGQWTECLYWLRGLNDTYRIRTERGYYILRVYRTEIAESDVLYELSLLTKLNDILGSMNTSVSEPIAKKDDSLYTILDPPEGKRIAAIFRYLSGAENALHDIDSCYAFGKSAAELHLAMDQVIIAHPRYELDIDFLIEQPLKRIIDYIGEENEATSFLRQFATTLKTRIESVAKHGLDWGICHGDMHGSNNAFQEGNYFTHYDFEWAAKGWRAYDLAQVKARKRQPTADLKEKLWHALLEGYRSVRKFSSLDEEAIDLFVVARRFWVMGLDVSFIHNDTGALDYTQEWLGGFIEEFRNMDLLCQGDRRSESDDCGQ
jgi:Ser/Thr protein kinase RdoA (MazF antagonist)